MKFLAGEWLRSAESDIETIDEIIDNPHLTHVVAFHSHQCIEKCLKAVFEEYEIEMDKVHNLLKLYKDVNHVFNIELDQDKLELLSKLYIDARYPSELGLLPYGKPATGDAKEFHRFAVDIHDKIKDFLESK
ncbi:MAG: HEPN domain-containing protein [Candidatus Kuenenia sp.]|nr:HEPN domain-containing protein [Candidatus Kuenenia hertensis]